MPPVAFRNPFEGTSQPAHAVAIIPARFASTRFPGKPLADLAGRPIIEHVYRRAASAVGIDGVVVATDDPRIVAAVEAFGGIARMTRPTHMTGTDRAAEIASTLQCEVIVNVQGDEPLIDPEAISLVVTTVSQAGAAPMATLRRKIRDPADLTNPHIVKVVVDLQGKALYFSRTPIPYRASFSAGTSVPPPIYGHVGLYGYQRQFLQTFADLAPTPLEQAESLEQLRALEHGYAIDTAETHYVSVGVDTPADLAMARQRLQEATAL